MNAVVRLAARGAWVNRGRSVLTVLAVVLSVGFMSAVLMLSGGLSSQSASGVTAAYRNVALVVHGQQVMSNPPGEFITQSGAPVSAAALAAVRAVPGVTEAEGLRSGYAVLQRSDGTVIGNPGTGGGVGQSWLGDSSLNPYHLLAGQGPTTAGQVALDQAAATASGVTIGQQLTLVTATGRHAVTVVGIVGYGSADGPFDTAAVLLPPSQAQSLLGISDSYDQILVSAPPGAQSAVAQVVGPWRAQVQSGAAWAATERAAVDNALSFERVFLFGFALVALLAGGTLISNTFTVTIAQRARELALARALGATTRQVLAAVLAEAAAVGLVASLVGAAVGVGVAALLRTVFSLLHLTLFDTHAVFSISSLALPALIGIAVTVLAALLPALRAARMAPIAALREPQIDESGRSRRRAVIGVALLVLGAVGTVAGVSGRNSGLAVGGVAALLIGVVTAGPLIVAVLARAVSGPLRRLAGPPGLLSGRALARNPRRSAATAGGLMIGVLLVSFMATVVASVNQATGSAAAQGNRAQYVVTTASPWQWQVSDDVVRRVNAAPGVTSTAAVYAAPALDNGSGVTVGTVDPGQIDAAWDFGWTAGSLTSLTGDQIAVQDTALQGHHLGDTLTLTLADGTPHTVRIAAVYSYGYVGFDAPTYLLPPDLFHAHATQPGAELLLVNAPHSSVSAISAALGGDQSVTVRTAAAWIGQGNPKVSQIANLFYALDALAVLLAVAGVTNTMALAVRERRRELGLLRAVGTLPQQIGRMVTVEAAVLAAYGTATGTLLGVLGCWALTKSSTSSDLSRFQLPAGQLGVIAAAAVVASVVLTALPARIARRSPVLEAITTE
ncbi:FtsX-like permease family protein [Streptacidiphilus sp. EB103A]|uniref:FtsX-like permease family protein n=1 Tax=Streptacidiphilus sp. EB103A TaxID=3156275 RepID=UPI0035188819